MNKTSIETFDFTWNPLGWGCWGPGGSAESPKQCAWCYAKRLAGRGMSKCPLCNAFEPHFHLERLGEPTRLKKPARIFVQSMGDLFGSWTPRYQIELVLDAAWANPQHTFFFLTKHPENMLGLTLTFPPNSWVGTTVTEHKDLSRVLKIASLSPLQMKGKWFLSIEPLLGPIKWTSAVLRCFDWIIIGALTGYGKPPANTGQWVRDLTRDCIEASVPIFYKNSLKGMIPQELWQRDLP